MQNLKALQLQFEEAKKKCWKYKGERGAYITAHNILAVREAVRLFLLIKKHKS